MNRHINVKLNMKQWVLRLSPNTTHGSFDIASSLIVFVPTLFRYSQIFSDIPVELFCSLSLPWRKSYTWLELNTFAYITNEANSVCVQSSGFEPANSERLKQSSKQIKQIETSNSEPTSSEAATNRRRKRKRRNKGWKRSIDKDEGECVWVHKGKDKKRV